MNNEHYFQAPSILEQNDPAFKLSLKQAQIASDQAQMVAEQIQIVSEQTQLASEQMQLALEQAQMASGQIQIAMKQTENAMEQTRLAREQEQLAMERTHLAWIRTLVVLMASGFALDALMETLYSNRILPDKSFIIRIHLAGLLMVVTGVVLSSIEGINYIRRYHQFLYRRKRKSDGPRPEVILSLLTLVVGVIFIYLMLTSMFF